MIGKRILYITVALLLFFMPTKAQRIEAINNVADMGQVMFNTPAIAEFKLKNRGHRSIKINKVYTSCGCTTVDYPQKPVSGGDDFSVKVVYDARQMGHFEKLVGIYANGLQDPIMLKVKGIVVEEVSDYVGNLPFTVGELKTDMEEIVFDNVNRGDKPVALMHIMNPTSREVQPVVMHLPKYLQAEVSPSKIAPGRSGLVTITLNSTELRDYGLTQTNVYLGLFPGDKVAAEKELSVSAILLPDFSSLNSGNTMEAPKIQLSTTTLDLGTFNGKKKLQGEINITNNGSATLDISALQMFTTGLGVSLNKTKLQPAESAKMKITATSKELRQSKNKPRILMITNDPTMPKVVIEIKVQ